MKKRLLSLLLCVLMVTSVIVPLNVNAKVESPFSDVPEGKWYTDGVLYCYENGFVSGTSATTFAPGQNLTRADIIMILANMSGANLDQYASVQSFTDVAIGKWYHNAVEWAKATGVSSGTTPTTFNPKGQLTRQELALLLFNFDGATEEDATGDLAQFTDASTISSWARTAMSWAVGEGLLAGSAGKCMPKVVATRAQAAVIIMNFDMRAPMVSITYDLNGGDSEEIEPTVCRENETVAVTDVIPTRAGYTFLGWATTADATEATFEPGKELQLGLNMTFYAVWEKTCMQINGNDISNYTIVYSADSSISKTAKTESAAKVLKKYLDMKFGTNLPVVSDETEPTQYEILVGTTNRETDDFVVTRSDASRIAYNFQIIGDKLVIAGSKDEKYYYGTEYGVYMFLEDYCGFEFVTDDIIMYDDSSFKGDDGFYSTDFFGIEGRAIYWQNGWEDVYCNDEIYGISGSVHFQGAWIDGSAPNDAMPCLSSEANIQKVLTKIRSNLTKKPNTKFVAFTINDSSGYCKCETCSAAYREDGTRAATLVRLLNRIADDIREDYPDVRIGTLAYLYAIVPPKVTKIDPAVLVYYCPIQGCANHPYYDSTCKMNKSISANIAGWAELCDLYLWDYSTDFSHGLAMFPSLHTMHLNANYFATINVGGIFNNAVDSNSGEFGELRAYLLTQLYRHPDMSLERYDEYMNTFLKGYYGDGWEYIREYIDLCEEMVGERDFGYEAAPAAIVDYAVLRQNVDKINELWDAAEAAASGTELEHVRQSRISAKYMIQCATYETMVTNGTAVTKNAYYQANDSLYADIIKYKVRFKEDEGSGIVYVREASPDTWRVVK